MKLNEELKKRIGVDLDLCWFMDCGAVWKTEEGSYCPICDTWRCPECWRCFCNLPPFTQYVLDAEMASIGMWRPYENPPKRKKRSSNIIRGATKEDFLIFCEHYYKGWLDEYRAGRISFDELKSRVERDVGLTWVF